MLVTNMKTNQDPRSPELPEIEPEAYPAEVDPPREKRMILDGIARYQRRQKQLADRGTASERDDYASVIRQSLLGVADRVAEALDKETNRKHGGPKSKLLLKINSIEEDKDGYRGVTVAYLTLSTIFNSLAKTNDRAKLATAVGSRLNDEANFHFIASSQPQAWKRLVRYAKEHGSYRHQVRFIKNVADRDGLGLQEWSTSDRDLLGEWCLRLVEKAELITTRTSMKDGKRRSEVSLQDHVLAWLEEYRDKASSGSLPMITPIYGPMTTVPRDWSNPFNGGYETVRYPLIKRGLADYRSADMSRVYAAVNAMQRTGWRINKPMLSLVEHLWATGEKVGKLPTCHQQVVPDRFPDEDWNQLSPEERKGWLLELRDIHTHNRQAASDLVTIDMLLAQARELQDADAFYMPHYLDFRGRAYCKALLSPQRTGFVRSMLEFATGKAVGERGGMWLAIQAASLWDGEYHGKRLSKLSFQDRENWAYENADMLRAVITDPLGDRRWVKADKPFLFLRTAIDFIDFLDFGPGFISHLPINLDGSCSGIQHYAALLLDADVGSQVNLLPSETPADVYSKVAEAVLSLVEADKGEDAADFWLDHGITRKVVKRPTMTYGYSSREEGFTRVYNREFVAPKLGRPNEQFARYLAKKTLAAVAIILPAVANGMEWLQTCVSLLAHEGKGATWIAPSGMPIVQREMSAPSVRVETELGGERLRVSIPGEAKRVNKERQKNGISPNHTHSLDAAHLMLTVLQAHDYGVRDFQLIHDSFGTLAADTDAMFSATRDAFVDMYETNDPFQHFYDSVLASLSEEGRKKLPLPPAKGDLDLSLVQQSLYAFA